MYRPPFTINETIVSLMTELGRRLGQIEALPSATPRVQLRKTNRIRTVQGTVAIEGNTLTIAQVTALLDGKRVIGPAKEIREVENTLAAYDALAKYRPSSAASLLRAHTILMKGLAEDAGQWRRGDVGIWRGSKVGHVAPPAWRVPELMRQLLRFVGKDPAHAWIKAAVFHYELEFIHPFSDGNGRAGRLWHHLLLSRSHPIFEHLPFESVIKARQARYYAALANADRAADATPFIVFSLEALIDTLDELSTELRPEPATVETRLERAKIEFGAKVFSRRDYLGLFKTLSTATASRDLAHGVKHHALSSSGVRATMRYRFVLAREAPRRLAEMGGKAPHARGGKRRRAPHVTKTTSLDNRFIGRDRPT